SKEQTERVGTADAGDSCRRTEQAWRRSGSWAEHLPHFDVHVFVDGRDEALGGRKEQRLHLYALRQSDAQRGRGKDRGARRRGSGGGDSVRNGGDFERVAGRAEARR